MQLDLEVARRGLDPAAETCEEALRHLLGVAVLRVERSELWRFDVGHVPAPEVPAICARLSAAASHAGRYVNLNRDRATWLDGPRPYAAAVAPAGCAVDVWVTEGDGADRHALTYFRSRAHPGLVGLRRGTLWRLYLPVENPEAARRQALEIAIARERRHGLLANPQAQTAAVLDVVAGPQVKETP